MGWKMLDLGGILGSSSDTKSIKTCIQEHLFFQHRIFRIFFRFWQHFGRSGRSSMVPSQSLQIPWDPYLQDVGAHCSPGKLPGAILISVWLNLGWFMGCFERILTWFWVDFSNFGSFSLHWTLGGVSIRGSGGGLGPPRSVRHQISITVGQAYFTEPLLIQSAGQVKFHHFLVRVLAGNSTQRPIM